MISRCARRFLRTSIATGCVAALTAGTAVAAAPASAQEAARQRFIVTLTDAADPRAVAAEHRRAGAAVDFVYTTALNGFAGSMSEADLGRLQRDRRVTRIERDGIASVVTTTQDNATWGLDRIDQRTRTLDGKYGYAASGLGVAAYVVDTGIRRTHAEFGGRVAGDHFDAFADGRAGDDCNGHGTHVAGTVGGTAHGVAKAVTLHAVRVLDCNGSGTWSGVIGGLDWIASHHQAGAPAVANMSLGGGASTSVDQAVQRVIDDGVTVVVAAGNGNQAGRAQDACGYSPARVPDAITIGATTREDAKTSWSNYGDCVDFFAPGSGITAAWHTGDTAYNTISGTSMAAPHVAGVAALHLQGDAAATPLAVRTVLFNSSTKGVVTSSSTSSNHLLYSHLTAPAPVVNGSVVGTITDASSAPLAGATVTAGAVTATTGSDGTYSLDLPAGTYTVSAAKEGFDTASRAGVLIESGTQTTVNMSLAATAPAPAPAPTPTLTARGYKVKGSARVDLSWTGSTSVTLHRNGTLITTLSGTTHTDVLGKVSGTFTYQVCATGTTTCSDTTSVTF